MEYIEKIIQSGIEDFRKYLVDLMNRILLIPVILRN
jgi:hypothetical protein